MEQKKCDWLKQEAEKWVADGIITPQQCSQIQMKYPMDKEANPMLQFFAVLGSLLIGAGIILVFATNWWKLPLTVRVILAFLPLLAAQGICLFTYIKKYDSAAYREGGALFLSLAFFATLALVGQIFHTSSEVESYMLVCILLTLPGAYFFRSKAAISIYIFGSIFSSGAWPEWLPLFITVLCLPYFYFTFVSAPNRRGLNYLLFLLSAVVINSLIPTLGSQMKLMEIIVFCGLILLIIDALFRKITEEYFFTSAKFFSIFFLTGALLVAAMDLSYAKHVNGKTLIITTVIAVTYFALRPRKHSALSSADLMLAAGILLLVTGKFAGITGFLLSIGLGIYYIVQGSRSLTLKKINYGMTLMILIILMRFFDSGMGLFGRGVVFIFVGSLFLGINLYISRKRKEQQS